MKRLPFKAEFQEPILAGIKTYTARWNNPKLRTGDVVAATCRRGNVPAHLVAAKDRFALVKITDDGVIPWFPGGVMPMAMDWRAAGFETRQAAQEWYEARRPVGNNFIHWLRFEVVPE